jgi:hypothetical protein
MTLEELSMETVRLIKDHWHTAAAAAGTVADGIGKAIGKDIWDFAKEHLTAAGRKEAVSDFEEAPDDPANQKSLEAALEKALRSDRDFVSELERRLERARVAGASFTSQQANQVGSENTSVQTSGSSNKTVIGRSK